MLVSICICTYKRPHLSQSLQSIAALAVPAGVTIEVVVVDNDELHSAKNIIAALQQDFPYPLSYYSEPLKNIASARNKLLAEARGDWIASIDDDEVADPQWLVQLKATADAFAADVVFGRVIPTFPDNTPEWIKEGQFFSRKTHQTGTVVSSGGSGCTLINRLFLQQHQLTFDLSYGTTGGEDVQLFYRMHRLGAKLVFCHEALVYEAVELNRLNKNYLTRRAVRIGQTYARYRLEHASIQQKALFALKNLLLLLGISALSVLTYPLNNQLCLKFHLKALDKYGKVSSMLSAATVELYK